MRKLTPAKTLTMGAAVCALTLLFLYAASVLPTGRIACCFLASLFVYALAYEGAYGSAILAFLAASALAFFLLPQKATLIPYLTLLGHYGIFKRAVDMNVPGRAGRFIAKWLYCNIFTACGALAAAKILKTELFSLPAEIPVWTLAIGAEVAFILYEILFTVAARFYENRIRNIFMTKR